MEQIIAARSRTSRGGPSARRTTRCARRGARARAARHHEALRPARRQRRDRLRAAPRRDPRAARRERRGQVDADERPLRPARAGRGRDPRWTASRCDRLRRGGDRARHRHGPPALHARRRHDRGREPRAGHRAAPAGRCSTRGGRGAHARALGALRARGAIPTRGSRTSASGAQQRVEILRALFRGASVLVLDEPTAVLTAQESQELFRVLRALAEDGTSIVFISHKLNEVLDVADRVTVLRRGRKIDTVPTEGATERSLARLMVGRDVLLRVEKREHAPGEPVLEVRDLHAADERGLPAVRGVVLDGAGGRDRRHRGRRRQRPERADRGDHRAAQAASGDRRSAGATSSGRRPRDMLDAGVGHIAEDRHRRGLVLAVHLAENLALREYRRPGDLAPRLAVAAHDGRTGARAAERVRRARRRAPRRSAPRCRAATSRRS